MDRKTILIIHIILVIVVISAGATYVVYRSGISGFSGNESNYWEGQYYSLYGEYSDQITEYNDLVNDYNDLAEERVELYAPSTLIYNGTVHWRFNTLDENIVEWTVEIDTYRAYIMLPEPTGYNYLYNSETDENYNVKNLSNYVQPDFFEDVISDLTAGNTDKEFVEEVVNLKNQLITYGSGLGDFYRWPAETLTEGRGQCGDTSILMASLLKAGEERKNYGIEVYFWYCDADNMNNPQDVNHVIVEVEYSDGYNELIETTADYFYSYDEIVGWKYRI